MESLKQWDVFLVKLSSPTTHIELSAFASAFKLNMIQLDSAISICIYFYLCAAVGRAGGRRATDILSKYKFLNIIYFHAFDIEIGEQRVRCRDFLCLIAYSSENMGEKMVRNHSIREPVRKICGNYFSYIP